MRSNDELELGASNDDVTIVEPDAEALVARRSIADENSFDQLVADLFNGGESLLQKHLTKDLYSQLLDIKTDSFESTLLDCIRYYSRNNVGRADIGLFATDSECYDRLDTLFAPIIEEFHGVDALVGQPACEWGDATQLGFLDPNADNIQWIRIACRRSINDELYTPRMNETQLNAVLEKVILFSSPLLDELYTNFVLLIQVKMAYESHGCDNIALIGIEQLRNDADWLERLQINMADYEQQSFWPTGRAMMADNVNKHSAALINFEDHLTFVSMQQDGNFGELDDNNLNSCSLLCIFI